MAKPRKLYDIDVDEITICASAANRKQFFIKKSKEITVEKFIEILKGFVVDEGEDDFTDEEIAKAGALGKEPKATLENALGTFAEYKESMPDELLAAAKIVVREAAFGHPVAKEDLEKAGAKLSKSTVAQITKALELLKGSPAAVAVLQTMLGQKVEKVNEAGIVDDGKEVLSEATVTKLEELDEFKKEKAKTDATAAETKQAEAVTKQVAEELKKLGFEEAPEKKSIDNPNETDDDKDKKKLKKDDETKDDWPSLYVPGLAERE